MKKAQYKSLNYHIVIVKNIALNLMEKNYISGWRTFVTIANSSEIVLLLCIPNLNAVLFGGRGG